MEYGQFGNTEDKITGFPHHKSSFGFQVLRGVSVISMIAKKFQFIPYPGLGFWALDGLIFGL